MGDEQALQGKKSCRIEEACIEAQECDDNVFPHDNDPDPVS
jgi:hypothetical protein